MILIKLHLLQQLKQQLLKNLTKLFAQIDQAPLNPDTTNEEVAEAIERINKAKVSGVKAIEATTTAQELER